MQCARINDHVVFTNDLGFSALLAVSGQDGPSVIQVRTQDLMPPAIGVIVPRCCVSCITQRFSSGRGFFDLSSPCSSRQMVPAEYE
jgi:predicted nuclease of predicted toxin-antitoxin system